MRRTIIIEAISILIMILFSYTALSKLTEYTLFKEQIAISPLLAPIAPAIAIGLPAVELMITFMLLVPRWRLRGLFLSLLLLTIFTLYVILLVNFSEELPCSCGGVLEQLSWQQHITFNVIFTALALWAILLYSSSQKKLKYTQ